MPQITRITYLQTCLVVCAIVLLAQFALVSIAFPLSELSTGNPLFHIDSPYHWYNMKLAANLKDVEAAMLMRGATVNTSPTNYNMFKVV